MVLTGSRTIRHDTPISSWLSDYSFPLRWSQVFCKATFEAITIRIPSDIETKSIHEQSGSASSTVTRASLGRSALSIPISVLHYKKKLVSAPDHLGLQSVTTNVLGQGITNTVVILCDHHSSRFRWRESQSLLESIERLWPRYDRPHRVPLWTAIDSFQME